jgi:thioesterase domain-containing protein
VPSAKALVTLRAGGGLPPVFFIHPSGGSVHWYDELARLLGRGGRPVYGLQARGLNGDEELHTRIEEMAEYYIEAMRSVQPEGPYHVIGWSLGVILAFEVARQLEAGGENVARLILFDQGPYPPGEDAKDDAEYLVTLFGKFIPLSESHLRTLDPDAQIAHVLEVGKRADWIHTDVTYNQFHHFVNLLRTHTRAWREYTPRAYPGRITLIRALDQEQEDDSGLVVSRFARRFLERARAAWRAYAPGSGSGRAKEPERSDMGWGQLAAGGVEMYDVPGGHITMLHPPHVAALARTVRECLEGGPGLRLERGLLSSLAPISELRQTGALTPSGQPVPFTRSSEPGAKEPGA